MVPGHNDLSSVLERMAASLRDAQYNWFLLDTYPFPLRIEEELTESLLPLASASETDALVPPREADYEVTGQLLTYAVRMATVALRKRDEKYVLGGALALVICNRQADFRDIAGAARVLGDAAQRIGCDVEIVFDRALAVGSRSRADTIKHQLRARPGVLMGLGSAGFELAETPEGPVYRARAF